MNQDPRREDELERQLLAHFRAHGEGEPSAELDARILAAAREAVRPPVPSLGQRLHAWLFGPGGRQRWSVAFAGLACLGVGVSLTFQNLDRQPPEYAVAPAPAMAPAAPAPLARSAPAPDAGYNAEPAAPPMQAFSAPAPAAEMKKAAPSSSPPRWPRWPTAPMPMRGSPSRPAWLPTRPSRLRPSWPSPLPRPRPGSATGFAGGAGAASTRSSQGRR